LTSRVSDSFFVESVRLLQKPTLRAIKTFFEDIYFPLEIDFPKHQGKKSHLTDAKTSS
jgi:hypothetical protein